MSASSGVPAQSCSVARDDEEATHVERNNLLPHSTGFGRRERRGRRGRRGRFCRSLNRSRSRLWRWRWGRRCRSCWRCRALRVGHFELILLLQALHQAMQISDTYDGSHTDARQNRQHAGCTARLCRTKIATAFAPGTGVLTSSSDRAAMGDGIGIESTGGPSGVLAMASIKTSSSWLRSISASSFIHEDAGNFSLRNASTTRPVRSPWPRFSRKP